MLLDILQVLGLMALGVAIFAIVTVAVLIVSCAVSVGWTVGHNAVVGAALAKSQQRR